MRCHRSRMLLLLIALFTVFILLYNIMSSKVDDIVSINSGSASYNVSRWKSLTALYHNWTPRDKNLLDLPREPHSSGNSVQANCIIKSKSNGCEVEVLKYPNTKSSVSSCERNSKVHFVEDISKLGQPASLNEQPKQPIFAITPTYVRDTQKADLTSLCQTIMHVQNMLWIVVEDSDVKTTLVSELLDRCKVKSIQLNIYTLPQDKKDASGVEQRNLGLNWIRDYCSKVKYCNGSVYFMDDDNKYDLRVFEEIKMTRQISVFPVGFSGGMRSEGPFCTPNGSVKSWNAKWKTDRSFPIDMAGFAVHVDLILSKPNVWMGFDKSGKPSQRGFLETDFLEKFSIRERLECRGNNREVLVWHVRTKDPTIHEMDNHDFEV